MQKILLLKKKKFSDILVTVTTIVTIYVVYAQCGFMVVVDNFDFSTCES